MGTGGQEQVDDIIARRKVFWNRVAEHFADHYTSRLAKRLAHAARDVFSRRNAEDEFS